MKRNWIVLAGLSSAAIAATLVACGSDPKPAAPAVASPAVVQPTACSNAETLAQGTYENIERAAVMRGVNISHGTSPYNNQIMFEIDTAAVGSTEAEITSAIEVLQALQAKVGSDGSQQPDTVRFARKEIYRRIVELQDKRTALITGRVCHRDGNGTRS
jgi:hypothetical protein